MRRLWLIIGREYWQMVGKKSFLFTTILLPILMVALCGILPVALANVKSDEQKTVAVTGDAHYALADTGEYRFVPAHADVADNGGAALYEYYLLHKDSLDLYAVVYLPDSLDATERFFVYSDLSVNASLEREVARQLEDIIERDRIASYGIDGLAGIMEKCRVEVTSKSVKWNEEGDEQLSSALVGEVVGFMLSFLTYFFVLMYGAMIMNGVIEEKTNRIVEVIVSTCKPIELMLGKIIGVALVGFTQIAIWTVLLGAGMLAIAAWVGIDMAAQAPAGGVAAVPAIADSDIAEIVQVVMNVDYGTIVGFFIVYFLGGYLLYASLFAAFGSAVDQPSDASQFMSPIMIVMVFAFYAGCFSIENPDGPLAWWCSIVPFTSPIVMMVRLPYDVPAWEIALSIALLFASAALILWIAARIYRTGILMYGKKVSVAELLRWIGKS